MGIPRHMVTIGRDQALVSIISGILLAALKAILLFNGKTALNLGHDLRKALRRVRSIKDIGFAVPSTVRRFIEYLDDHGPNRYLEVSTSLQTLALLHLDYAVWHVRRYCFYMRGRIKRPNGTVIDWLPLTRRRIHKKIYDDSPHKYRLPHGMLEEVLTKRRPGYESLVWKNFCYGRTKKKVVKNIKAFNFGMNPTHIIHPEAFSVISKHFYFSKDVRDHFATRTSKRDL